ncbi:hypothetical protein B0A49_06015 [Cryomyces minteri]|uniref:CCD97-like C-terminal domain-containing protein n=1 Tax=Cryomyces minteri TaxID=331657 RepID=A0A4U0X0E5_9PEZI|nr:hypothetical protein B0A49_06015 [Cryomyces minteri]
MPFFPPRPKMADGSDVLPAPSSPQPAQPVQPAQPPRTPGSASAERLQRIRVKNRRKRYLDLHPEYFGPSLELADPLLYDRLVRRFQSAAERRAQGLARGYSGRLEADLLRSEAKLDALAHPDPSAPLTYRRRATGEIVSEERDDVPRSKEEGLARWREVMERRFLNGEDAEFEYAEVDASEKYDDWAEEEREREEAYFGGEEPAWVLDEVGAEGGGGGESGGRMVVGETGVQDY